MDFCPIKVNETWIKNRIVVPPMEDFGMTGKDGCVNARHLQHYGAFAEGGAGLAIAEACVVSKMNEPRNTIRIYDDRYIPGFESPIKAAKKNNSVCIVQLLNNGPDCMRENRIADISRYDYREAPEGFPYGRKLYAASLVKKDARIPVIGVGGIQTGEQAESVLKKGIADMVAVGRGHLCRPDWTDRAMGGRNVEKCRNCGTCMWYIDGRKCPVVRKKEYVNLAENRSGAIYYE